MLKGLVVSVFTLLPATLWPVSALAEIGTGGYGGLSYGGSDIDGSGGLTGDGDSLGIFAGFNWESGDLVYGIEADWDSTDYAVNAGAVNIDHTARLKGRLGLSLGGGLGYATAGIVHADTDSIGEDTGYLYGLGYDLPLGNTIIGGEVLQHEFEGFDGSAQDISVTTFKARLSFRF